MKVQITQVLYIDASAEIELPKDITWDDIRTWTIVEDIFLFETKKGEHARIKLNSKTGDIDFYKPTTATVWKDNYKTEISRQSICTAKTNYHKPS